MKRGRKRKYCAECHNEGKFDSNGLCRNCAKMKEITTHDHQAEYDKWAKEQPAYKVKHCATKQLNVYERLELLEKQGKCIQKLRKEVTDLRKQVYGNV